MSNKLELYHGSGQIVEFPEIRKTRYTKDFSWGFYCTNSYQQAHRWAERKHENGIVNDIVNIGLHFILKNVRPYAAPCSEA